MSVYYYSLSYACIAPWVLSYFGMSHPHLAPPWRSRTANSDNIASIVTQGMALWKSIYQPHANKLYDKLGSYHPDFICKLTRFNFGPFLPVFGCCIRGKSSPLRFLWRFLSCFFNFESHSNLSKSVCLIREELSLLIHSIGPFSVHNPMLWLGALPSLGRDEVLFRHKQSGGSGPRKSQSCFRFCRWYRISPSRRRRRPTINKPYFRSAKSPEHGKPDRRRQMAL